MVLRDTTLRCASEPKHTALVLSASDSRGIRHFGNLLVQPLGGEVLHYFLPERIGADGTYHTARQSELRHVVSEISGRTAYFFTFGEHVPQSLAHSYNYVVHDDSVSFIDLYYIFLIFSV